MVLSNHLTGPCRKRSRPGTKLWRISVFKGQAEKKQPEEWPEKYFQQLEYSLFISHFFLLPDYQWPLVPLHIRNLYHYSPDMIMVLLKSYQKLHILLFSSYHLFIQFPSSPLVPQFVTSLLSSLMPSLTYFIPSPEFIAESTILIQFSSSNGVSFPRGLPVN